MPSKMAEEAYPIYPEYEGLFGYPSKADIRGEEREAFDRGAVTALREAARTYWNAGSVAMYEELSRMADEWEASNE